jgi:bifunctional UDP-N-acetylglucosamine pyrophosphorylase/glucosamine-1-phosphate N-acetyltransferase
MVIHLAGRFLPMEMTESSIKFIDKRHTYVSSQVEIGEGTIIYPNCHLEGKTKIGVNCTIEPGCLIRNCIIEDGVTIKAYCYLEDAIVRKEACVGPFAHLRPESDVGEGSKVGNFVEIKKSKLEKAVKISHLSYLGDAQIGEKVNIGCGFITCNYDGEKKYQTKIGAGSFIGSDSQAIAPVEIGKNCYVASGTTITRDTPDNSFTIARVKQLTKKNWSKKKKV